MQRYLPNTLIRNKETGKTLFVAHVYRICLVVFDPTVKGLPIPRLLLERDYPTWLTERDFEKDYESREKTDRNGDRDIDFHYNPVTM